MFLDKLNQTFKEDNFISVLQLLSDTAVARKICLLFVWCMSNNTKEKQYEHKYYSSIIKWGFYSQEVIATLVKNIFFLQMF